MSLSSQGQQASHGDKPLCLPLRLSPLSEKHRATFQGRFLVWVGVLGLHGATANFNASSHRALSPPGCLHPATWGAGWEKCCLSSPGSPKAPYPRSPRREERQ